MGMFSKLEELVSSQRGRCRDDVEFSLPGREEDVGRSEWRRLLPRTDHFRSGLRGPLWQSAVDGAAYTTEMYFLIIQEVGNPRSRLVSPEASLSGVWVTAFPVSARGPGSVHVHPWCLSLILDQGPTLRTSLDLNYLLKGPVSKCSHFGGWGLDIWMGERRVTRNSL